jgi:hypothetical protein
MHNDLFGHAEFIAAFRSLHLVEGFTDFPVFSPEEHFAEGVAVGSKEAAGVDGHREQTRTGQLFRECLVVGTTVEAEDPCFRTTIDLLAVGSNNHFAGWVEGPNARESAFGGRRLVGNEINRVGAWLAVDPFMEAATHATAAIIVDFDFLDSVWQFHGFSFQLFQ